MSMRLILRLAWRNVGRNRRRTALTVAAAVFAVVLVSHMIAMTTALHEKMIEDSVRVHSGHLQVTGAGYLADRTLEHYVVLRPALLRALDQTRGVIGVAPRLNGYALLSNEAASQGVALIGVDPQREGSVSTLPGRLVRGEFLPAGTEHPIVLGEGLAKRLGVDVGGEVLVYTVAYTLENAYELYRVSGVMRLPTAQLDRSLALIALADAQALFGYDDRVSEVALRVDDPERVASLQRELEAKLAPLASEALDVNTWRSVVPEIDQMVKLDDIQNSLTVGILVVVVAFGILNTLLMSVLERQRELGVLLALGLAPPKLFGLVYVESLLLSGLGIAIGLALSLPTILYMQAHPIQLTGAAADASALFGFDPVIVWKLEWINPLASAAVITAVAVLAALYPAVKAASARPLDALRTV
jgi:ABC-type lipoprotein release transport system permease subunit